MEQSTQARGRLTNAMAKELTPIRAEMSTKESGCRIFDTARVSVTTWEDRYTQVYGTKT